jgi:hypothetical protein
MVEARFTGLAVSEGTDGTLVIEDPDYGIVKFHRDGSTEAEGRTILPKDFTIAGEVIMLATK